MSELKQVVILRFSHCINLFQADCVIYLNYSTQPLDVRERVQFCQTITFLFSIQLIDKMGLMWKQLDINHSPVSDIYSLSALSMATARHHKNSAAENN